MFRVCSQLEWDGLTQAIIQVRDLSPDSEIGESTGKKVREKMEGKEKDKQENGERKGYCCQHIDT